MTSDTHIKRQKVRATLYTKKLNLRHEPFSARVIVDAGCGGIDVFAHAETAELALEKLAERLVYVRQGLYIGGFYMSDMQELTSIIKEGLRTTTETTN